MPEILLWLFVMNLGVAFGAGLYETESLSPNGSTSRRSQATVGTPPLRVMPIPA